jgi:predicted N-acetyltransferase YhbS
MTVLVAVDQSGHVIGTIAYRVAAAGEGHLRGMAVNPEWHGLGVAQNRVESDCAGCTAKS